nr:integrase, catalytic region, zinc finger, CCHC-type, peptidase aspartic, catalytic [Tanacetum cinerariifolium]
MGDIGCYNDNLALMLALESDEVIRLEKESRSKLSDLVRPFDYDKLNNLYDLFVPQCEKSSERRYFSKRSRLSHTSVKNGNSKESFNKQTTLLEKRMDESIPWDKNYKSSIKIFKVKTYIDTTFNGVELCKEKIAHITYSGYLDPFIQNTIEANFSLEISRINAGLEQFHKCLNEEMVADLRYFNSLELEDKGIVISELKKLIEKLKGISVDTKFEKSSVIRQSNTFKSQLTSVLGKPNTFLNSFERKDFSKLNLNAKTLNVNYVSATCDKCVLNDKHDMCVLNSVAKPFKKTVALESNQKPRNITRKLYEHVSKACSWWYPKFTPSGYKWKPKSGQENVNPDLVEIVLFIVDSGCSKHMTRNLKLLINFVENFLGTVKFGNDQIAPILGYGDLVQGDVMIKRVYYVEGLNHNLFSVGQFCDADLEVAFRKSTCYIRDLKGNDLLIAGSKDRPLMLAPGNYIQWKSRIKRYIDTKPNQELIQYCLVNPPYELGWKEKSILDAEGNPTTVTKKVFETYQNIKQEIIDQLNAEAEAVQIILTGIDNDIYSTVDACSNACEMWKVIKRLKQGESINVQDLETNLFWEFGKFTLL